MFRPDIGPVIVTEMPDLPPRPETACNAAARREFYRRWGHENAVICGAAQYAEYAAMRQTFSVKTVMRGQEHYYVNGRRVSVGEGTWLVLDEGREYSSVLQGERRAYSYCLFFRPGLAAQLARDAAMPLRRAMDFGTTRETGMGMVPTGLGEQLRVHDRLVSPVLQFIHRHVQRGVRDPAWYDEQFRFLFERILRAERRVLLESGRLECQRRSTREEITRRIGWAVDEIRSNLGEPLPLRRLARRACLSEFHFLRLFRQLHRTTPAAFVKRERIAYARSLLEDSRLSIEEVAARAGLSRVTLWRYLKSRDRSE